LGRLRKGIEILGNRGLLEGARDLDEGMGQETGIELLSAVSEGKELNMCTRFRPDKSGLEAEATVLLGGEGMTFV
jgi:hypothetical protein